MRALALSAVLGVVTSVVISLGLVSTVGPDDLSDAETILTVYGER